MKYNRCKTCKKRLSNESVEKFCNDVCESTYKNSTDVHCKQCKKHIGKSCETKKQFCNLKCSNLYQKEKNKVERTCIVCKNTFVVQKSSKRHKLCSEECEEKYTKSKERNSKRMKTLKQNNVNRYGTEYTFSLNEIKEKSKETKRKRYGNLNNFEKVKKTKKEKYGNEYYVNNEKAIDTKLKKHGTLNFNEKANKTKLKKHGTLNFSKKANKTKKEKYGTLNFSKKANKTKKEKYGNMSVHMKNKAYHRLKSKYRNLVEFLFDESEYKSAFKYVLYPFKCKKCKHKFKDYITNGSAPRCLKCNPKPISIPQTEIFEYVKLLLNGYEVIQNTRTILKSKKELDIYVPHLKIAIEFDGIYWHSENSGKKDKMYHLNKTIECEQLGIQLIHIFENEWNLRQDIVKSKLKRILKIDDSKKIYARKCIISEISAKEKNDFLKNNHIQGEDRSKIKLGAFYKDELVAVMTFGKRRVSLGNKKSIQNEYELYRFCTTSNIIGIGGKLISHFIKNYNPSYIISYADRRFSNSDAFYKKIGFVLKGSTPPNYWYFKNPSINLFHRFNFRKDQLSKKLETFDHKLTEWENMKNNGWDRIWDCGNLKYEWKQIVN